MIDTPRIYVADLAAYNGGILHGIWIEMPCNVDRMHDQIQEMLRGSPVADAEEYAIHDYECFQGYSVGEYESLEEVCEIAEFLSDFSEFGGELLNVVGSLAEARRIAVEGHCGLYSSLAGYAQEMTEECSDVPEHLVAYIDYQAMGRDWELSGELLVIQVCFDKVHIFHNS